MVFKRMAILALAIGVSLGGAPALAFTGKGTFFTVTPNDPVEGTVLITPLSGGAHQLKLESDFMASAGPDLHLVLHKDVIPMTYNSDNAVIIAPLRDPKGAQVYRIPAGVDPAAYKAVIVWCRRFDVTFGSAALVPKQLIERSLRRLR